MSLVASGAIPQEYTEFYEYLPSSAHLRDALPEPDVEETEFVQI